MPRGSDVPGDLCAHLLVVHSVRDAVSWRFVRNEAEYKAAVDLLTLAYARADKIDTTEGASLRNYADQHARIFAAWYFDIPVGSVRLMAGSARHAWEHDRFVTHEHTANHAGLPPRAETVEVAQLCTHPDWRDSDLVHALLYESAKQVLRMNRRYLIGSATEMQLPRFLHLGCESTEIRFRRDPAGEIYVLFYADLFAIIGAALRVPRLVWTLLWSKVASPGYMERPATVARGADLAKIWALRRPHAIAAELVGRKMANRDSS